VTKIEEHLESRLRDYEKGNAEYPASGKNSTAFLLTASAAAGLGALICPPPAEAAVQYSGMKNIPMGTNAPLGIKNIDMDSDGVDDFLFGFMGYDVKYTLGSSRWNIDVKAMRFAPAPGNSFIAEQSVFQNSTIPFPARLPGNYTIQSGLATTGTRQWQQAVFPFLAIKLQTYVKYYSTVGSTFVTYQSTSTVGKFIGKKGYLGVRFQISGNTHYGWIQFTADEDLKNGKILDWAYEDQLDTPIKAGAGRFKWNMFLPAIINGAKQNP